MKASIPLASPEKAQASLLRHVQRFAAAVAIILLLFGATAEFLPHHHESEASERVCQLCHPTVIGVQTAALQLPAPIDISWSIVIPAYISANAAPVRQRPSRAPPAE